MSTRNDARAQFDAWAKEQHLIGASGYSPSGKIAWQAWQAATLCAPLCEQPDVSKQRDMLAEAIGNAAVKSGIYRSGMSFSGPQLLMACDDMASCILAAAKPVPEGMVLVQKKDIAHLELLISQWKAQAATGGDGYDGTDYDQGVVETLLNCADDLTALINARIC